MKILITGGTGFLGRHTARMLLNTGYTVHLLGRNFSMVPDLLADGAIPVQADLRNRDKVMDACAGMDAVVHAGAMSAPWGKKDDFFSVNVDGTASVIAGCCHHQVQRLVYISSPSVTFDGKDAWYQTESSPYPRRFTSIYSLTKKLGEDLICNCKELPTVILRPKAIFGPGDQSLLPRLISAAHNKRLIRIGDANNLVDITYVDNVAHAICLALNSTTAIGKTYTITNDEHRSLWDIIDTVLTRLELTPPAITIPFKVAIALATGMEWRAALTGIEPPLTCYSVKILTRTQTYDISAAKQDLNYLPLISVDKGIDLTISALREVSCT